MRKKTPDNTSVNQLTADWPVYGITGYLTSYPAPWPTRRQIQISQYHHTHVLLIPQRTACIIIAVLFFDFFSKSTLEKNFPICICFVEDSTPQPLMLNHRTTAKTFIVTIIYLCCTPKSELIKQRSLAQRSHKKRSVSLTSLSQYIYVLENQDET